MEDIYFFEVNFISSSAVKNIILYSTEIQKAQPYFFLGRFSFDLTFAVCLMFNGYTIGCKHCLYLANGLESCSNEWKVTISI